MKYPPFHITSAVLNLTTEIHEILGEMKNLTVTKPSVKLRKENKIKTVHHSLAIEGNNLTEDQITDILENKRVLGPEVQIQEVKNALAVYDKLHDYEPLKEIHLLKAHRLLMQGLVKKSGQYRASQVGILKGTQVSPIAPPAKQVPNLMIQLFKFLKDKNTSWLIKACVFHYELEFIHPFNDGNGRMGRLWQQLILMKQSQVFEYISTESLIHNQQKEYYSALEKSDKAGDSTPFVEFSLQIILDSLKNFKNNHGFAKPTISDRIQFAIDHFKDQTFSRKEYMTLFPQLSTATASRDLASGVKQKVLTKDGDKTLTTYKKKAWPD